MAIMSDQMHAWLQAEVARVLMETAHNFRVVVGTNKTATTVPTQSVTRDIRIKINATGEYRAFIMTVGLSEIASGSVAGATVAATDDITV